jgi:hypothetical protein
MPRGPKGEKRPADVIGAAVMVVHASDSLARRCEWRPAMTNRKWLRGSLTERAPVGETGAPIQYVQGGQQ